MKKIFILIIAFIYCVVAPAQNTFVVDQNSSSIINETSFDNTVSGGDTIFIASDRTKGLVFIDINGSENSPVVVTNKNGLVIINDSEMETAIELRNCSHIKLVGSDNDASTYGFELSAHNSGISVTELSTNIEIAKVKIKHDGFFGIVVKKDYEGNPPDPIPVFEKLVIHDCLVENVTEGMYLGETTTPGMEFKHVKVYNNIVANTGRDGIQLANMVEDIEVFNNLIMDSGQDQLFGQGNNLQIGDNSVGDFHHNILLNANAHGIIVLGAGDINITNNYFEGNQGLYIDNRSVTISNSEIRASANYFRNINDDAVVKIGNELNNIILSDNFWYSSASYSFFDVVCDEAQLTEENNTYKLFAAVTINDYVLTDANSTDIKDMGPQENLIHSFNYKPIFDEIEEKEFQINTTNIFEISASTFDDDSISFQLQSEYSFIQLNNLGNGLAEIEVYATIADTGSFEIIMEAWDNSHKHKSRQAIRLNIRNITSSFDVASSSTIAIFPNPALDKFSIESPSTPIQSAELITLSGTVVNSFNTKDQFGIYTYQINRGKVKPGLYMLCITFSNNTRMVEKLMVH